jgi:hypothetical protein
MIPATERDARALQPVPIPEHAELRRTLFPMRDMPNRRPDRPSDYEKILVERVYMSEPQLPATVLRLPMAYGPGDWHRRRPLPYVKRMEDGRPAILAEESFAGWRATRGYVENVAVAIASAVLNERGCMTNPRRFQLSRGDLPRGHAALTRGPLALGTSSDSGKPCQRLADGGPIRRGRRWDRFSSLGVPVWRTRRGRQARGWLSP